MEIDKIDLLEDIINNSKEFKFVADDILKIRDYYRGDKEIYINFIGLIEVMCEKLDDEDIDRILLTTDEYEEEF